MSNSTIVRAWKDAAFAATLAPGAVPAHPAGSNAVAQAQLKINARWSTPKCTEGGPICDQ